MYLFSCPCKGRDIFLFSQLPYRYRGPNKVSDGYWGSYFTGVKWLRLEASRSPPFTAQYNASVKLYHNSVMRLQGHCASIRVGGNRWGHRSSATWRCVAGYRVSTLRRNILSPSSKPRIPRRIFLRTLDVWRYRHYILSKRLVPLIQPVTQRLIPCERKPLPHRCKHLKKSQIYHYLNGTTTTPL